MSAERNLIKTMDYVNAFWPETEYLTSVKKDAIGKGTSRGVERYEFQFRSTFQWGVT